MTDLVTGKEQAMENMCAITGCTEDQCTEPFATHSLEGRSTEEAWNLACDMLLKRDRASETRGSLAQE